MDSSSQITAQISPRRANWTTLFSGTVGKRLDGPGWLLSPASHQTTAIHDEEVPDIVAAIVPVHHTRSRIIPHSASPHEVEAVGNIFYRPRQTFFAPAACKISIWRSRRNCSAFKSSG